MDLLFRLSGPIRPKVENVKLTVKIKLSKLQFFKSAINTSDCNCIFTPNTIADKLSEIIWLKTSKGFNYHQAFHLCPLPWPSLVAFLSVVKLSSALVFNSFWWTNKPRKRLNQILMGWVLSLTVGHGLSMSCSLLSVQISIPLLSTWQMPSD